MSTSKVTTDMVEYHVPVPGNRISTQRRRTREISTLSGAKVGLLVNSFDCSKTFLEEVGRQLISRFGIAEYRLHYKRDKSLPAEPELIAELQSTCDAVIDGVQI